MQFAADPLTLAVALGLLAPHVLEASAAPSRRPKRAGAPDAPAAGVHAGRPVDRPR
jgi:hypothetical protein